MIRRCVGGHWPPLRLGNVQMVDKRCAEVAPQGTFSCPSGNSPCPALHDTICQMVQRIYHNDYNIPEDGVILPRCL